MEIAGETVSEFLTKSESPSIRINPIRKPIQPVDTATLENTLILCFIPCSVITAAVALIPNIKRNERRSKKVLKSLVFKADNIMPIIINIPRIPIAIDLFTSDFYPMHMISMLF